MKRNRIEDHLRPVDTDRVDGAKAEKTQGKQAVAARRVLLADDHTLIRQLVSELLETSGEYRVTSAASIQEVLDELDRQEDFDIVLLDIRMPGQTGIDSVKQVIDKAGSAKFVLFSSEVDRGFCMAAVAAGGYGLLPKSMNTRALLSGLKLIQSGEIFVPNEIMSSKPGVIRGNKLRDVEVKVLALASEGLTNKEIAARIGEDEGTVKMHMRSLTSKLSARNRAHASAIAIRLGLV